MKAKAMFVSGPVATIVLIPDCTDFAMNSTALSVCTFRGE